MLAAGIFESRRVGLLNREKLPLAFENDSSGPVLSRVLWSSVIHVDQTKTSNLGYEGEGLMSPCQAQAPRWQGHLNCYLSLSYEETDANEETFDNKLHTIHITI